MSNRRIAFIGKLLKHLLSHRWIGNRLNLVKPIRIIRIREVELLLDKRHWLLGKELRRETSAHLFPIALFLQLIDCRQRLLLARLWIRILSIGVIIEALTIRLDIGAKGIVLIVLDLLKNSAIAFFVNHRRSALLVGIEHDVNTLRKIVGIHGHALEIVCPIHKNTNLCVVRVAQIKILDTGTNLHHTVLAKSPVFSIANCNTLRIDARGIFSVPPRDATVLGVIVLKRSNLARIIIEIFLCDFRLRNNLHNSALS